MTERPRYPGTQPFYFDQFSDSDLTAIYQSGKAWLDAAPALSTEIGSAVHDEIERRFWLVTNPDTPKEPAPLALHFDRWSDRDVGDALRLVTVMSYVVSSVSFGELVDYLAAVLAEIAGQRLGASGDDRNAVHFLERNLPDSQEGTANANPEAN